jgi:tetratricopeptide (TPR) repeat protein
MKNFLLFFLSGITALCIMGCNDKNKDKQPYDEILSRPPFASLTDSIRKQPANHELYFRRAVLLNENDLPEPALADFYKAWSLSKEEKYAFGTSNLLLEKKPDSAIIFLEKAIKDLPGSFLLRLTLGKALLAENKLDEALSVTDELLDKNPKQVDVLKMKADILNSKGLKKEAVNVLEQAYQLTPGDVELNYMLALHLAETGNPRVLSLCDSLAKADSLGVHAEPYYYKGIYFSTINDREKALSSFDLAVRHDYYFLDGYIEKGSVFYDMKKYNEALGVFNLCLTVSPKYAEAYYWIAKTEEALGKKEEALVNYERAYSLDPGLTEAKQAIDKLK